MKTLPKCITGFGPVKAFNAWVDVKKPIKDTIYACGARVLQELPCDNESARNYHIVVTDQMTVLVNSIHPVVAFTLATGEPYMEIPFVDWPKFVEIMQERHVDWACLAPSFLEQKPTDDLLSELDDSEMNQFKYWQTESIGDIMFNNRD